MLSTRAMGVTLTWLGLAALSGCDASPAGRREPFRVSALAAVGDTLRHEVSGELPPERRFVPSADLAIAALDSGGLEPLGRVRRVIGLDGGRALVHDASLRILAVVAADGHVARRLGAAGGGPGEVGSVYGVAVLPGDTIVIWDGSGARLNWYDGEGRFLRQQPVPPTGQSGADLLWADTTGALYLGASVPGVEAGSDARTPGLWRMWGGQITDSVPLPRWLPFTPPLSARMSGGATVYGSEVPFLPRDHYGVTADGVIVAAPSDAFVLYLLTLGAREVIRVERLVAPVAVPEEERTRLRERLAAEMRQVDPSWTWNGPDIPSVKPAHRGFAVDRVGRLWVQRSGPSLDDRGRESALYEVYAADGAPIASVRLPESARFASATRAHLWWVRTDSLDVPVVERASLALPAPLPFPRAP